MFLRHHIPGGVSAEDLLNDVFLRALRQDGGFCKLDNPRAWLFEVARNLVTDQLRRSARRGVELSDDLAAAPTEVDEVDQLAACLPRVLSELSTEDREAIERCDLEGMPQAQFAALKGLSLPGAKSRIQRARRRLRLKLLKGCQVRLDSSGRVCCFVPRPPLDKRSSE
jgi:RNA polymerase sigma-70 factor (ECF subfamily)